MQALRPSDRPTLRVWQAIFSSGLVGSVHTRGYYLLAFGQEAVLVLVLMLCFRWRPRSSSRHVPASDDVASPMLDDASGDLTTEKSRVIN